VVEGATPVGHTPGGGEVRRGRGGGSTPGGGEVHRVTTRPARTKKRKVPAADADSDEEPEPARARGGRRERGARSATDGVTRPAPQVGGAGARPVAARKEPVARAPHHESDTDLAPEPPRVRSTANGAARDERDTALAPEPKRVRSATNGAARDEINTGLASEPARVRPGTDGVARAAPEEGGAGTRKIAAKKAPVARVEPDNDPELALEPAAQAMPDADATGPDAVAEDHGSADGAHQARPAPVAVEIEPPEGPPPPATSPAASVIATAVTSIQLARAVASQALSSAGLGPVMKAASALKAAVITSLGISAGTQVDAYGKDTELVETFQPISDFLYDRYWRVSVAGVDHIPEGGAILVSNHSGAIPADGPVLRQALQRERPDLPEARWLVEDQIFDTPFLGTLFNRMGAVRACPENAFRLLEERRPVIVFPEGIQGIGKPFTQRYQLKRLGRGGFAKLAVRSGMPIVPVAVVGAEEAWPLLAKLPTRFLGLPYWPVTPPPLPAKWTIRFGEPLRPSASGATSADDPAVVQPLVDSTRGAIEGMLRALLDQRQSVFRG
jgi:1-acyl-sn-glycerol-3-phosphate acyltransferase